jgi:hypothetical protein
MYVTHGMAVLLDKHPAKKYDANAKKVTNHLAQKYQNHMVILTQIFS